MTPPKVLITILTTYERAGWICKELGEFIYSLRFNEDYATALTFAHNFVPAAGARNFIARNFRESEAEWLLMLDNDMAPPANLLDTIKDAPHDAGIIAPMFWMWDQNKANLKLCWGMETNGSDVFTLPDGTEVCKSERTFGIKEITKCGTGAIFIRREVFDHVPAPWFEYRYDDLGNQTGSEDIRFCEKAREYGIRIYGNGNIVCGHYKSVNLATLDGRILQVPLDKMLTGSVKASQETASPVESMPPASPVGAR